MAVRNWHFSTNIDGRRTIVTASTRGKEDGFNMIIRQRRDGDSVQVLEVIASVQGDNLKLIVIDPSVRYGKIVHEVVTQR